MLDLEILIKKIDLIDFKHKRLKEIGESRSRFNIFTILRDKSDEVNLHSKFIYELLNPLGSHDKGDIFLKLFLRMLNLKKYQNDSFKLYRERANIDILLLSKSRAIIIENKINTQEHSNQLERYLSKVQDMGYQDRDIEIIYLTLNGDAPDSLAKRVIKLSYRENIRYWLEESIKSMAKSPIIRETLSQYLELIKQLTYQDSSRGFIMETKDLLLQGNNLELILSIEPAVIKAKIEIQLRFWKELIGYLRRDGYKFNFYSLNGDSSIEASVEKYYTKKKSNMDYGFEYKLLKKSLYFFIEIRKNIYYGFYFNGDVNENLLEVLESLNLRWQEPYWKYSEERLNFEEFNSNVLDLIDEKRLEGIVESIGSEIIQLIERFKKERK